MQFGNPILALALLTFLAVVLLIEGLYFLWMALRGPQARKLHERLRGLTQEIDSGHVHLLKQRDGSNWPMLEQLAHRLPGSRALQGMLDQSGLGWSRGKLLG